MVGAYCGSAHKFHIRAIEERGVATRASAHHQGIGIGNRLGGELLRLEIHHLAKWLQSPFDVWDMRFYYRFHLIMPIMEAAIAASNTANITMNLRRIPLIVKYCARNTAVHTIGVIA